MVCQGSNSPQQHQVTCNFYCSKVGSSSWFVQLHYCLLGAGGKMLGQIANHLPRPSSLDCGQASTSGRCIPNVVSRTHRRRHAFSGQSIGTARLDVAAAAKKAGRPPSVQPDQPAAIEEPPAAGKKGRKRGRKPASETVVEGPPTVLEKGAPSVPLVRCKLCWVMRWVSID
jgi:hypothetical protein